MKREIKFRGKDLRGQWQYGDLIHNDETDLLIRQGCINSFIKNETAGQFTGLRDNNGREIYEGDIVAWSFFRTICSFNGAGDEHEELLKGVIEWRQGGFIFRVLENDFENAGWYSISDLHTETQTDVEIIGNIYDNPELLKGGEK